MLFYLLELHHTVIRLGYGLSHYTEQFVPAVRTSLKKHGVVLLEADEAQIRQALPVTVAKFAEIELNRLVDSIGKPYEQALSELSRDDPFLAYKLFGRDKFGTLTDRIFDSMSAADSNDWQATRQKDKRAITSFVYEVLREELELAIRAVGWRCDVVTHAQVIFYLHRKIKTKNQTEWDPDISDVVEDIVARLIKTVPARTDVQRQGDATDSKDDKEPQLGSHSAAEVRTSNSDQSRSEVSTKREVSTGCAVRKS